MKSKPVEGLLYVESRSGAWRSVKAVFSPPHSLVLDGVAHIVSGARHHSDASLPRKQADYGIQISLANGSVINVAATSGLEKYDWIERLNPKSSLQNSPLASPARGNPSRSASPAPSSGNSELVQKLLDENDSLRAELDAAQTKMLDMRSKLKEVAKGYKDELRNTIALKKQLLAYETQIQELQKEVSILRELTGTEEYGSGSEEEERDN